MKKQLDFRLAEDGETVERFETEKPKPKTKPKRRKTK